MNYDHGGNKGGEDPLRDLAESNRRVNELEKIEKDRACAHEQILKVNAVKEGLIGPGNPGEKLSRVAEAMAEIFDASLARIWIAGAADLCNKGCPCRVPDANPDSCRGRTRCLHLVAYSDAGCTRADDRHLRMPSDGNEIQYLISGTEFGSSADTTNVFPLSDHLWTGTLGLTSCAAHRLFSRSGTAVGIIAIFASRAMNSLEVSLFKDFATFTSLLVQLGEAEEKDLPEGHETYRSIFENAVVGAFQGTPQGKFIQVNPAFARMHGYSSPEEMIDAVSGIEEDLCANPPEGRHLRHILQTDGVVENFEMRVVRGDGVPIWTSISARAVKDLTGKVLRFEGTVVDISDRKYAEAALKEREGILWALVNAVQETLMLLGPDGTVLLANEILARRLGTTPQELIGSNLYDHLPPEVAQFRRKQFEWVAAMGESVHFTDVRKGRHYETHAYPVFGEGKVTAVAVFAYDITERGQSEQRLLESEERYRVATEQSNDGVVILRGNERLYYNRKYLEMLGYEPEELAGTSPFSTVHPGDRQMVVENARRRQKGESVPSKYECRMIRKDGSEFHVEISASTIIYDGAPASLGYIRDVTFRKHVEETLHESELKYRSVVESSLVGFYLIQDDLFRFVNQRFCEIFGFTHDEIVDKLGPLDLAHPDDRALIKENLLKRLTGEKDRIEYEFRGFRKDRKPITVKVFGGCLTYRGKIAAVGTLMDTTRENMLESQLRQSQKMEAIGILTGGIAHDFNNILTAIIGYGTLLRMQIGDRDVLRLYVDDILSSSEKAAALTQALLAFSRQQPVSLAPVDLNELVKGTVALLGRLLTEDIAMDTSLAPEKIVIMADASRIDQILINLATNARDAMQNGGTLTVETKRVQLDSEFIHFHGYGAEGYYALITVIDTGSGMDAQTRERIFDPFFTTKPVGKGTGLGLSTVYGIVKQHDGYINVYSEPGHGTTFNIYFPVASPEYVEIDGPRPEARGGTETILVAEDDKDVRRYVVEILVKHGYRVIEAIDGQDAIDKFREHHRIDLVLIDSVMPRRNGREAYDEIRRMAPHVKAVFTSGYTRDVILDKGIGDREFEFISKPLLPHALLAKVREVLDK